MAAEHIDGPEFERRGGFRLFGATRPQAPLVIASAVAWIAHIVLVWAWRFVPSVDYPEWLFQAHILANFQNPAFDYSRWYALCIAPVPNGGFVLPAAFLSMIVPAEMAGKIVLTGYLLWFPLALMSFYRAIGQKPLFGVVAVALFFNIMFFNGNMGFLIGLCALFSGLAFMENRRTHVARKDIWIAALLALCIFLTHGVCAAVFSLYCFLIAVRRTEPQRLRAMALTGLAVCALLALVYVLRSPDGASIARVHWEPDLRYRLSLLTKPFLVGWSYPPHEFSVMRFVTTACFVALGWSMVVLAFRPLRAAWRTTPIAILALAAAALTFLGPKHLLGVAELSHRFALIWFPLAAGFTRIPEHLKRTFGLASAVLLCCIVIVRWHDYGAASALIERRHAFLSNTIKPGSPILTLDDRLGEERATFLHLVPKGVSLTFQTDYLLLAGGYQPLSFRTFILAPRDSLFYYLAARSLPDTSGGLLTVPVRMIPNAVAYVVIDAERSRAEAFAAELAEDFRTVADAELAGEIRTLVLRRLHR